MSDKRTVLIDTLYDADFKYEDMTVSTKKLVDLDDNTYVTLNASVPNNDNHNEKGKEHYNYNIGAKYCFNRHLSVGLAYT